MDERYCSVDTAIWTGSIDMKVIGDLPNVSGKMGTENGMKTLPISSPDDSAG